MQLNLQIVTTQEEGDDTPPMPAVVDNEVMAEKLMEAMTAGQREAAERIIEAVKTNGRHGNCFFLHGSGGCGKTYVYKVCFQESNSSYGS